MWREKKQILRAYKCVFLYVNILPLGVSIRGGNLKSAFREYERLKSFLHGLGSVSKIGEFFFAAIIIICFYLVVVFALWVLHDDLVVHR